MAHVLIVDDEADLAGLVVFSLNRAGLETEVTLTGGASLVAARLRVPSLVLLDLMLPDISGKEVCRRLRNDSRLKLVPIIMLTARDDVADRIDGFEVGADDYVTKPFSPRELVLRVNAMLRRSKPSLPAEVLRLGTLVMNVAAHFTTVAGESVELTVLEFRLLHALMSRPGGVQTRLQLLADVWGITDEQDTRTVDTHVMRLREKLGVARSLIETVRGVG